MAIYVHIPYDVYKMHDFLDMERTVDDIKQALEDIELKITGLEIKIDALLYYLADEMEEAEAQDGDEHGRSRDDNQVL